MAAPKGNKFAPGGKRPGAGAPSKEAKAEKISFLKALLREREKRAETMALKYYDMAESDPATMRHLVDRVIPPAKQEFGITAEHSYDRDTLAALMLSKAGKEAAEAVTKALIGAVKPVPANSNGNNGSSHDI